MIMVLFVINKQFYASFFLKYIFSIHEKVFNRCKLLSVEEITFFIC